MDHLSVFLKKFKKQVPKEHIVREQLHTLLKKELNLSVELKHIRYQNNIIYVTADTLVKSEIALNKARVLKVLEEGLRGVTEVRDIL